MDDTPYARLAAFRAKFGDETVVDEQSGLSAADLDVVLADRRQAVSEEVAANLGDLA